MRHLANLFKIIELTRSQPQYGYALSGLKQYQLSNLAEHHYLVTFIAWQIATGLVRAGANINIQKVLEFALIHDLGELFGGDISMPYAKANPKAREFAKAFETENQKFLAQFFGEQSTYYQELSTEILDAKSDESVIAKIADYLEVTHYKLYVGLFEQADLELIKPKMQGMIERMQDHVARKQLANLVAEWTEQFTTKSARDIICASS